MRSVTLLLQLIATLCASSACARDFFENSLRRSPLPNETNADAIVEVLQLNTHQRNCTGFFVKNTSGRVLVASARHCFAYKATEWCASGGIVRDQDDKELRTCSNVVAGSVDSDFIIFEFNGGLPNVALTLSGFFPPLNSRLIAYGYPIDRYARPGLNVSENCWVRALDHSGPRVENQKEFKDQQFLHNCTIYGGNSGGPMVLEGTSIVVGMPSAYSPNDFGNKSSWQHPGFPGFKWSGFVERFSKELKEAGVEIAEKPATTLEEVPSLVTLTSGIYSGDCLPGWTLKLQAVYNSNTSLSQLRCWWKKGDGEYAEARTFQCSGRSCALHDIIITIQDRNKITYSKFAECVLSSRVQEFL